MAVEHFPEEGDRRGGVEDPFGYTRWVGRHPGQGSLARGDAGAPRLGDGVGGSRPPRSAAGQARGLAQPPRRDPSRRPALWCRTPLMSRGGGGNGDRNGRNISTGIAIGVALGVALDKLALGIAIGVGVGVAIGAGPSNRGGRP